MKINTQQNNNDMTDLGEAAVTGILMGFKSGRKILELGMGGWGDEEGEDRCFLLGQRSGYIRMREFLPDSLYFLSKAQRMRNT